MWSNRPNKREDLRTTLASSDPHIRVVAVFGTLYNVLPQGYSEGDVFDPSVTITVRYNTRAARDPRIVVAQTQRLALAYFDATTGTGTWGVIADAVEEKLRGTFTATVNRAGAYGVIIIE